MVIGASLVLAGVVFGAASRIAGNPRRALIGAAAVSTLLLLTAPLWYLMPQPVLGLGAILIARTAPLPDIHPVVARITAGLGILALIGNLAFVVATFAHFLAG